jgi:hypothetical protein
MNDLGISLVWLTVQVTTIALVGLVLSALLARRTPAAGATAALTSLALTAMLAALACSPLPSWWAWDAIPLTDAVSANGLATRDDDKSAGELPGTADTAQGGGIRLGTLMTLLRSLGRDPGNEVPAEVVPWRWPAALVAVAGTGTALGILRLLLGLWAIRQSWRRSRPVDEPEMLQLVKELQTALGVKPPVAVHESADLTTAATFGWRESRCCSCRRTGKPGLPSSGARSLPMNWPTSAGAISPLGCSRG